MAEMTKIPQPEIEAYHAGYQAGYENGKRDAARHGYWNKTCVPDVYQCDVCKKPVKMDEFCDSEILREFCPKCGAKMDRKESGE